MTSLARRAALAVAVFFPVLCMTACAPAQTSSEPAASLAVEVVAPRRMSWASELTASGPLKPWQEAVISAETGPLRIASLQADVGSVVRRGSVLATLASETVLADRARLQAQVAEGQANLAQARSDVARADQVGPSGALSAQQIQKYRIAQQTAEAAVASARAQLRAAEIQLGQTKVVAVDDGVISSRAALLGKVVSSGEELFRMVRHGRVEWQAELDARQLAQVSLGDRARVILPGGRRAEGVVRLVSPVLDSNTSRGIAYVQLAPGSGARAGMYGSGAISVGVADVLTVPDTALVLRDGRAFVFVLQPDMAVRRQTVTAGQRQDGLVAVAGVAADAKVVKSGGAFLNDGAKVRLARAGVPVR